MPVWKPAAGYASNPMKKFGRNVTCLCQSGKKIKNCCGIPAYVTNKDAKRINDFVASLKDEHKKALGIKVKNV